MFSNFNVVCPAAQPCTRGTPFVITSVCIEKDSRGESKSIHGPTETSRDGRTSPLRASNEHIRTQLILSTLAIFFSLGRTPMLVYVRPSNEALLRVRVPRAQKTNVPPFLPGTTGFHPPHSLTPIQSLCLGLLPEGAPQIRTV